ncbi:MAG: universal stress protein [Halobaculum sp.]
MEHAVAVVGPTETAKALVREAGELAGAVGAKLTLLHVTDEEEYEDRRDQLSQVTEVGSVYSIGQARDGAKNYAEDVGREVLEGVDVEFEPMGRLGDPAEVVVRVVEEIGADHIFVTGPKRSPAGKALFGDDTQRIILDATVPVTVVTE